MKLQLDKAKHFGVGFGAQLIGELVNSDLALLGVAFGAWFKEDSDRKDTEHHTPDGWDAFATVCGAIAARLVLLVIRLATGWVPPSLF